MSADTLQTMAVVVVTLIVFGIWQWLRRSSFVSESEARRLRSAGAPVIDVRTPGEFASGHVAGAVNVPLDGIGAGVSGVVSDKAAPLLLYCRSGGRSGMARMLLRRAGYTEAHNLGSLERARKIFGTPPGVS